jgi:hypothetical protein
MAATKLRITNLSAETKADIRQAVTLATRYWPNAHLGDCSVREDIRSAFYRIRNWAAVEHIQASIGRVYDDALSHADM